MRFFSNEAKESADDRDGADNENDPERAGGVPQQRTGSPWSDAPGNADASTSTGVADPETRDDSVEGSLRADDGSLPGDDEALRDDEELRRDDSEVRHDGDDLVRDADSPQDAGPAREDDPLDLPLDDRPGSHRADLDGTGTGSVDEEPGAEQRAGTTTTYEPDGTLSAADGPVEAGATSSDTVGSGTAAPLGTAVPLGTTASDGTVSDSAASDTAAFDTAHSDTNGSGLVGSGPVEPDSGPVESGLGTVEPDSGPVESGLGTVESGTATSGGAADEQGDRDLDDADPVVATAPVETTPASDETGTPAEVEAAPAVPVGAAETATGAKPDPSAAPVGDKLFTDGDSFAERLRDIALNFVDDPKDATAQAGALVDEAIDKVTSALKAQKDALAGEGDDTERLRVELRGYRDILKRISSL